MDIRLSEVVSALSYALDVTEGQPGKLDAEEWVQMRRHPALTVRILERVGAFRDLAATAGAHHERLDGSGYPLGLAGDRLNRDARTLAVATSARR